MRYLLLTLLAITAGAEPVRLHPQNPHYFLYKGKPTVLLTSAEHYGAVLNKSFNYVRYLDTLAKDGLNYTRIFSGIYREVPNDFGIAKNTLAPEDKDYVSPYAKVQGKYDLKQWNPAYFTRLKDFLNQAHKRGIVVELTLFCMFYKDHMWNLSPFHPNNNSNGVGQGATHNDAQSLKHPSLTEAQSDFTRKIVTELKDVDNVIFEICNEPYFGVTPAWQAHIASVIKEADQGRHLIAQNIANNHQKILDPNPNVSLFQFHYARPPITVMENFHLNKAIGLDETGFDGTQDFIYRIQAWDFLIAGGSHYNNLDYSFAPGFEDGTLPVEGNQPGGGSVALRKQLGILKTFLDRFDLIRMHPDPEAAEGARVLSEPGRQYAIYVHQARIEPDYKPRFSVKSTTQKTTLNVHLPPGTYEATWWDTKKGRTEFKEKFQHQGSTKSLESPPYTEDIALQIIAIP